MDNNQPNPNDPKKPKNLDEFIGETGWQILELLFDSPRVLILGQIAAGIKVSETETASYVDTLEKARFIEQALSWQIAGQLGFKPWGFQLTDLGRALVIKRRQK